MAIGRFEGGNPSARDKLNRLVEEVNALAGLRGDEKYIVVRKGPGGSTVALNVAAVLAQVPRLRGGAGTALKFAKISGHVGTEPPYLYSGVEVEHDGSSDFEPENFEEVSGGDDLANKLISLSEIGTGGTGVGPLEEDSIVSYWAMGAKFACVGVNYKGTY